MLDPPDDPSDPLYQHLLIEAYRSDAWNRGDRAVDADHTLVPDIDLVSDDRLARSAASINPNRSGRWPRPHPSPAGTAGMTVRDSSGMGISLIQSNFSGIGSGLSSDSTGVFLHNRGAGFNLIPGHPNEFAIRKRPLHTLSPTLWTDRRNLDLLLGTRGGDQQPQFLSQFAASFYHAANCSNDSQELPRWNMGQPHPGTDSIVEFESRTATSTIRGLTERGHTVELVGSHEQDWGPVSAIDCGREVKGSADPRITTSAALATQ
jgi:gamma-glutamyltranspeptidase/glutathione hydrolase